MNPFTVLGLSEKAYQDETIIKDRFQELSKSLRNGAPKKSGTHIDLNDQLSQLNEAYEIMLSPGRRLQALLELRFRGDFELKGAVPSGLLDLFTEVSQATQEAKALAIKKGKATTALSEAVLAPTLLHVQSLLSEARTSATNELKKTEGQLDKIDELLSRMGGQTALAECASICRKLIYLEKWRQQLETHFHALI